MKTTNYSRKKADWVLFSVKMKGLQVEDVRRCELTWIWRLIDQHGVHAHYVRTKKIFHIVNNLKLRCHLVKTNLITLISSCCCKFYTKIFDTKMVCSWLNFWENTDEYHRFYRFLYFVNVFFFTSLITHTYRCLNMQFEHDVWTCIKEWMTTQNAQ